MFIAALFTIAKLWKQPTCSLPTNGSRKCGIYTQWNFTEPQRRMKFSHSQINAWSREYHLKQLSRLRRPKITCSPSYVDYRHKTNTVIVLDISHTLRGECPWEKEGKERKPKT
jgi:hypothetical protein